MTIVRLSGSKLLLHSPIEETPELVREVRAFGTVAHIIAPNRLHHLFVGEWQEIFPEASTFVAPGLDTKRDDLVITGVLDDEPEPAWRVCDSPLPLASVDPGRHSGCASPSSQRSMPGRNTEDMERQKIPVMRPW